MAALLAGLGNLSCCPYGVWGLVVQLQPGDPKAEGVPVGAYPVGDTVAFLADERFWEADCYTPAEPSTVEPGAYDWSISGDAAELIAPGVVVMRQPGEALLDVSTAHTSKTLGLLVVDRVAAVRLTPDTVVLHPGDSVAFLVEALDADGRPIPEINRPNGLVTVFGKGDPQNPVAFNQANSDGIHFVWRANRLGVEEVVGRVHVYGTRALWAEGLIEVVSRVRTGAGDP